MGRASSTGPKSLKYPEEDKLDMVLNCTRAEYMKMVGSLKKQRLRDDCEEFKYWGDLNLRGRLKGYYVKDEDREWEVDEADDLMVLSKAFERFEASYEEREMKKAGKEYDDRMDRMDRKSKLKKLGIEEPEDEDCPHCG